MGESAEREVLIVEADASFGLATSDALQCVGFTTQWRTTVAAARIYLYSDDRCPDAILLELDLPDGSGEHLIGDVRALAPSSRIIAISSHLDGSRACALLTEGVATISKPVDPKLVAEMLLKMLAPAEAGTSILRPPCGQGLAQGHDAPPALQLTEREEAIVGLLVRGAANKDIARELRRSVKTIEFHISNLLRKTATGSRAELVVCILSRGLGIASAATTGRSLSAAVNSYHAQTRPSTSLRDSAESP